MRCSTPGMRRWTKGRKSPSHTWSNQPIAHPMHRIRNVRFNILVTTCRETLKLNLFNEIYVEIDGKIVKDETVSFINDKHIIRTIQRIVQPLGRTIDSANPMVDARLRDGSRLNAVIPPLSLKGPILTIRKFNKKLETIDDLLRRGSLTVNMARFLEVAVEAKLNIIISGGTGTGKTTLLNI